MKKTDTQAIHSEISVRENIPDERPSAVDSWWRTQSATIALLKHAQGRIDNIERELALREERIRQLEDLADTDSLTGLMNRRGFEKFFAHELARIRRHNSPGGLLVLVDLDHFKQINDSYGHQAGDACLAVVADQLLQSIRIVDGAARFGGDEFALLLTQTDAGGVMARMQKIKQKLNKLHLEWHGEKLHFGASLGAAIVTGDSTYEGIYCAADKQLYADKQAKK